MDITYSACDFDTPKGAILSIPSLSSASEVGAELAIEREELPAGLVLEVRNSESDEI